VTCYLNLSFRPSLFSHVRYRFFFFRCGCVTSAPRRCVPFNPAFRFQGFYGFSGCDGTGCRGYVREGEGVGRLGEQYDDALLDTAFSAGLSGFHGSGNKEVRPSADAGTPLSRSTTFQLVVIDEELWSKDVFCGGKLKATRDTFCTNFCEANV